MLPFCMFCGTDFLYVVFVRPRFLSFLVCTNFHAFLLSSIYSHSMSQATPSSSANCFAQIFNVSFLQYFSVRQIAARSVHVLCSFNSLVGMKHAFSLSPQKGSNIRLHMGWMGVNWNGTASVLFSGNWRGHFNIEPILVKYNMFLAHNLIISELNQSYYEQ